MPYVPNGKAFRQSPRTPTIPVVGKRRRIALIVQFLHYFGQVVVSH
jgi:hypothetical protein